MSQNVVLCYPVQAHNLQSLRTALPGCTIIDAGQEGIAEAIFDADIFVGHAKVPVDWEGVVAQGRLKMIQSSAAGLDHCLVPPVIDSDIPVCSASGLFANQVAEQTFALLFGMMRSLPTFFRQAQAKQFVRRPTFDVHGKRVGIVGLGGNGRRIASLLSGFQVETWATDYYPVNKPACVEQLLPADEIEAVAQRSEILILSLPLNASTHKLVNERVFQAMPKGSWFVNVARGQVVDEDALVSALESQHLSGAAIDVAYEEPLPESSRLWDLENVLISPHVGAQSARRVDDSTAFACLNVKRFLAREPLFNEVDKTLGFPHPERVYVKD